MKRSRCTNFVVGLVIAALLCVHVPARAQDDSVNPANTPSSANSILNFLSAAFELLMNPSDPMNWVAYAAIGSWWIHKNFFGRSVDFARGTRDGYRRKLEEMDLTKAEQEKRMAEMNALVATIERNSRRAERAVPILNRWMSDKLLEQVVKSGIAGEQVPLEGLAGYHRLETWLKSKEGMAFLLTNEGASWHVTYRALINLTTTNLDAPLADLVTKAGIFSPAQPFRPIESAPHEGGLPGEFNVRNDHDHSLTPLPLRRLPGVARSVVDVCRRAHAAAVGEYADLSAKASWWNFWTSARNRNPVLFYATLAGSGVIGTGWLVRAYNYKQRREEAATRAKQNSEATTDLYGWLSGNKGRKEMEPYYSIFLHTLRENRQSIIDMFEKELTEDERKKFNVGKLIDEALTVTKDANGAPIYPDELISAVGAAAKKHQGDRTAPQSLIDFINNSKKDKATREGLFRAFNKDVLMGFVNKKWPDFTVGNPSDSFKVGPMRTIQDRVVELLEDDKKMRAPSPAQVPPAPGVTPMPVQVPQPMINAVGDASKGATPQQVTLTPNVPAPIPADPINGNSGGK